MHIVWLSSSKNFASMKLPMKLAPMKLAWNKTLSAPQKPPHAPSSHVPRPQGQPLSDWLYHCRLAFTNLEFYVNENIQYVLQCLTSFSHHYFCETNPCSFITTVVKYPIVCPKHNFFIHFIITVISSFGLLEGVMRWTILYKPLGEHRCAFLLGVLLEVVLLGLRISICPTLADVAKQFPSVIV